MQDAFADPAWADFRARFSDDLLALLGNAVRRLRWIASQIVPYTKEAVAVAGVLKNQTVVVLGASTGIGAAVAERALAEGASVVAISRSGAGPKGSKRVATDVTDHCALASVLKACGPIDHLVYTVGARIGSPALARLGEDILPLAFETKVFGAVHTVRLALPYLAPNASITLTSGQVSRKYGVGTLVKGAVNAAVDAIGRHLAKELAPRRVNVVSPGVVDTSLWGEPGSDARNAFIARVSDALPVKRVGVPGEVAQAYLFAMTNGFVTGALIDIDGGGLL